MYDLFIYLFLTVSGLLSLQPSRPTEIWFWKPSPRPRTPSPKPQHTPQVCKFKMPRASNPLSSPTLTSLSLSSSVAEADCSCGAPDSPGQQWRDECSHPAGPGAPAQPGAQGPDLRPNRATYYYSTWCVRSAHKETNTTAVSQNK